MEWKKSYLDLVLVPLGFLITISYHVWLWHKVQTEPLTTTIGRNAHGRRFWVEAMMKVSLSHLPSMFFFFRVCSLSLSLSLYEKLSATLISFKAKASLSHWLAQ